jgi:hypothetical protein
MPAPTAYAVSPLVNNARHEGADSAEPLATA